MDYFKDFHKVKDLQFDIVKLRRALNQVLSKKMYDDSCRQDMSNVHYYII